MRCTGKTSPPARLQFTDRNLDGFYHHSSNSAQQIRTLWSLTWVYQDMFLDIHFTVWSLIITLLIKNEPLLLSIQNDARNLFILERPDGAAALLVHLYHPVVPGCCKWKCNTPFIIWNNWDWKKWWSVHFYDPWVMWRDSYIWTNYVIRNFIKPRISNYKPAEKDRDLIVLVVTRV